MAGWNDVLAGWIEMGNVGSWDGIRWRDALACVFHVVLSFREGENVASSCPGLNTGAAHFISVLARLPIPNLLGRLLFNAVDAFQHFPQNLDQFLRILLIRVRQGLPSALGDAGQGLNSAWDMA